MQDTTGESGVLLSIGFLFLGMVIPPLANIAHIVTIAVAVGTLLLNWDKYTSKIKSWFKKK